MSTVIKCENLSKYYRLGVINNGVLFRDIQTWIARKRGKEDPHSKIGSAHHFDATKEGFWALKDLNFDIKQGDRVGIIGKNGAGKSTLLKILSRITAPTEGSVKIKGRVASLLEVGTGFHGELTGRENIYLNGAILGMKRREVARKMDEIIAFSEIDKHIDTPVKRYSSGMYVKLAFSVAAHLDSEILIADEVLAVGDASFQKKAIGKMSELSTGQGRTVLFVSHNMPSVKNLCNTGILLEQGRAVDQAPIDKIISGYLGVADHENINEIKPWINTEKDFSPNFNPLKIEIIDSKGKLQVKPLEYTKDYKIRLTFDVKEVSSFLQFGFHVALGTEELFRTVTDISEEQNITTGTNIYEIAIPAKTLYFNNTYRILLNASLYNIQWISNPYNYDVYLDVPVVSSNNKRPIEIIRL